MARSLSQTTGGTDGEIKYVHWNAEQVMDISSTNATQVHHLVCRFAFGDPTFDTRADLPSCSPKRSGQISQTRPDYGQRDRIFLRYLLDCRLDPLCILESCPILIPSPITEADGQSAWAGKGGQMTQGVYMSVHK